jgi:hypothetical protein
MYEIIQENFTLNIKYVDKILTVKFHIKILWMSDVQNVVNSL